MLSDDNETAVTQGDFACGDNMSAVRYQHGIGMVLGIQHDVG